MREIEDIFRDIKLQYKILLQDMSEEKNYYHFE